MEANMALGLFNEAKSRPRQSDDWEQDLARLEHVSEMNRRERQFRAAVARLVAFFRRPTPALRAAHV
jgi:hypothetical protein